MILVILQFNIYFIRFREVVLGEYQVGRDPDCTGIRRQSCAPPKITRKVAKTIIHEDYKKVAPFPNDIALIRLDEAVPLHQENPKFSSVIPVCLPWNNDNPGNNFIQGDEMLIVGWGRITNKLLTNRNNLLKFKISTRTLQKLFVPIVGTNCSLQNILRKPLDFTKQICAGGEASKWLFFH